MELPKSRLHQNKMPRLNRGRQPPTSDGSGGWEFPVEPGVMLRAGTEEALVKLIFEYRQRKGVPIGSIEEEINEYYCTRWPDACHPDQNGMPAATAEPMLNRVALWASKTFRTMPRGGYELETSVEAQRRAQTCVGCPNNKAWRNGCSGCHASTSKLLLDIRKMRKTTIDGNLLACAAGSWCNQTAVHLPAETTFVTEAQRHLMPDRCWRKAIP